ncbi:MAG: hypothetical protein HYY17_12795, partial [Planctomycetes bacterium]|nr:hypothetical protein [Planctomycetota bacterium]
MVAVDRPVGNGALRRALVVAGLIIVVSFGLHEGLEKTISRRAEPYLHHHLHTLWGAITSVLVAAALIVPLARGMRMPLERPFPSSIPGAKPRGLEEENRWLIQTRWGMSVLAIVGVVFSKGLKDYLPSTPWIALAIAAAGV